MTKRKVITIISLALIITLGISLILVTGNSKKSDSPSNDWIKTSTGTLNSMTKMRSSDCSIQLSHDTADYYIIESYNGYKIVGCSADGLVSPLEYIDLGKYKLEGLNGFYYEGLLYDDYDFDYIIVKAYDDNKIVGASFIEVKPDDKNNSVMNGEIKYIFSNSDGLSEEKIAEKFSENFNKDIKNDLTCSDRTKNDFKENNDVFTNSFYKYIESIDITKSTADDMSEPVRVDDVDSLYNILASLKLDNKLTSHKKSAPETYMIALNFKNQSSYTIYISDKVVSLDSGCEYELTDEEVASLSKIIKDTLEK